MLTEYRKTEIIKLSEFITSIYSESIATPLESIAKDEGVSFYFDNYEDAFDGMLLYDKRDFHIHINIDTGNRQNSKRGRYTFAHELGHYFINEHRIGLKYGYLEPHSSFHNINQKTKIELEADYFASCLLMPAKKFKDQGGFKKFSFETIFQLSNSFQSSILSTVIRFSEVGTHEILVVVSRNNKVCWFSRSKDFPNWPFKFKVGDSLPPLTVAGEYFADTRKKFTNVEEVEVTNWFHTFKNDSRAKRRMYEQCYYSDSYGYVISLIWFE